MRRPGIAMLLALVITGCATTNSRPSFPQDATRMVGSWHGWLITPRSFTDINLEVRADTSFELGGDWGIHSTGVLVAQGGRVRFDGSRGWRGTLTLADSPTGPILKLERDDRVEQATLHRSRRQE